MRKVIIIIISSLIKNQANKDLKQGVGRPNKKNHTKIEQLEFHQKCATCSGTDQLKIFFPHYLLATETHRKLWLVQLHYIKKFKKPSYLHVKRALR